MSERTYDRSWVEIEDMLDRAEREQNMHYTKMQQKVMKKSERIRCVANYKALEGVIKTLKWTLGEKGIEHPLE
tara:strand:- start:51 stop:269 length:219 start_codon:yes stop_codon:yes gene_type:complete